MNIDVIADAATVEAYVVRLVADTLGPNAVIAVVYGPPDELGLVCAVGEAHPVGGQSADAS